jgi:spermidine synthase
VTRCWDVHEILHQRQTAIQEISIVRTAQGISLFCNGERQSTEQNQEIYHEGQILPAVLLAEKIDSVLVIGSSEGAVSKLALDCGATRVVHVDIDRECVEACARFLPYGYQPEELSRFIATGVPVEVRYEDGATVVRQYAEQGDAFDVIVLDLPDEDDSEPEAQQNRLYSVEFNKQILRILAPGGAFISQAGCATYWRNNTLLQNFRRFRNTFVQSVYFELTEQDWTWLIGLNRTVDAPADLMKRRLKDLPFAPQFIDAGAITAGTVIPPGLKRLLEAEVCR